MVSNNPRLCLIAACFAGFTALSLPIRAEQPLDLIHQPYQLSAYIPNGQVVGSAHYAYKLAWLRRLRAFLEKNFTPKTPLVVCGDFNVARDELDVAVPAAWEESVLYHPTSRTALEELLGWGLVDVFRQEHPEGKLYSWWDYRMLAFPKNDGLRLDYIFATAPLATRCTSAEIDRQERKGTKPSDHAPVIAVFDDG